MDSAIVTTVISSIVSLIVAFGTWHVSMKKDREKQTEEVLDMLNKHREEYLSGISEVKDEVSELRNTVNNNITSVRSDMQMQNTVIDLKITELKEQVEKHNNVIERTYKLEQQTALHEDQIKRLEEYRAG